MNILGLIIMLYASMYFGFTGHYGDRRSIPVDVTKESRVKDYRNLYLRICWLH
jgi:hypothetical protein